MRTVLKATFRGPRNTKVGTTFSKDECSWGQGWHRWSLHRFIAGLARAVPCALLSEQLIALLMAETKEMGLLLRLTHDLPRGSTLL